MSVSFARQDDTANGTGAQENHLAKPCHYRYGGRMSSRENLRGGGSHSKAGTVVAETVAGGSALTDSYFDIWPGPAGWAEISWYPAESVPRAQPSVKPLRIYVRVAADKQTSSLRIVELRVHEPSQELLRGLPLGRIEIAANTQLVQAYLHRSLDVEEPVNVADYFRLARRKRHETPRFVLKRPQTRRLPDAFYKDVARAYRDATERGLNPRKTLAIDAGTPADTVARWIGESRRRGLLPPAEPGKVSA